MQYRMQITGETTKNINIILNKFDEDQHGNIIKMNRVIIELSAPHLTNHCNKSCKVQMQTVNGIYRYSIILSI